MLTAVTRKLVKERGHPMELDARKYFEEGVISEREYKLLAAGSKQADLDAGET